MAQIKILLLENDITRGKEIMDFFTAEGNRVEWVTEHVACQKWLDQEVFDALILEMSQDEQASMKLVE